MKPLYKTHGGYTVNRALGGVDEQVTFRGYVVAAPDGFPITTAATFEQAKAIARNWQDGEDAAVELEVDLARDADLLGGEP